MVSRLTAGVYDWAGLLDLNPDLQAQQLCCHASCCKPNNYAVVRVAATAAIVLLCMLLQA
jgi:hypothetical protein